MDFYLMISFNDPRLIAQKWFAFTKEIFNGEIYLWSIGFDQI